MKILRYKNFFDLENFEHKDLWKKNDLVWSALFNISKYIEKKIFEKIKVKIPKSCYLENETLIHIGENTTIEPNTFIKGPCIIGKNCTVRHGSHIRGSVIIGNNSTLGHCCEIKNSIVLNNSSISHFSYVGDSILGNFVNLAAGVKIANLRFDKKEVFVSFEKNKNKKVFTGLKKFGAIISDFSKIGCNSVINPGTIIGKNSICYGSLNIFGYIEKNSIVKPSSAFMVERCQK